MKAKLIRLVFCAVALALSGCSDSDDSNKAKEYKPLSLTASQSRVSEQANTFSLSLFNAVISENGSENVLFSPVSANLALSMLDNATAGNSRAELNRALGFADDLNTLNEYNAALISYLPSVDNTTELYLPNSFWFSEGAIKQDFKTRIATNYNADIKQCAGNSIIREINSWVARKTNGNITRILEDSESCDFAMINSMFLKATWKYPFDKKNTKKADFYNHDGSKSSIDMMCRSVLADYAGGVNYTSVSLPFGNGAFSFDVVLPDEGYTIEDVMLTLAEEGLPRYEYSEMLNLLLPKLSVDSKADLIPVLKKLGVNEIFTSNANLSEMYENTSAAIKIVRQANKITFDENGVVVASVTGASGMVTAPGPPTERFVVDHPFIFFVREQSTNSILLSGRINKL